MATAFPSDKSGAVQIDIVVTCCICKESTTSQLIQLKCFHMCHKSCLKRSLRKTRQESTFMCRECKTTSLVPTDGVEGYPEEIQNVEAVNESHQIEKTPSQLRGCHLESKWETDGVMTGVSVDCEDIIAVRGNKIGVYGMKGEKKGKIECQGLGDAWDIEIVNKQLFISDWNKLKREILVIDRKGNIERKISLPANEQGLYMCKLCLAVDHTKKDIYISSSETNTVYKCPKGQTQAHPLFTTELSGPCYLCITPIHEVIITSYSSHTVSKYNSEGTLVWEYGRKGTGEGELYWPQGVCVDSLGHVFVCDWRNDRIHHMSPVGKFLSFINIGEKIVDPWAITFNNDRLIITSGFIKGKIFVIKWDYN